MVWLGALVHLELTYLLRTALTLLTNVEAGIRLKFRPFDFVLYFLNVLKVVTVLFE